MLRPRLDTLLAMVSVLVSVLLALRASARSRIALQLEILALRHQLQVLQRTRPRQLRLATMDRWVWVVLSRLWTEWRAALVIVKPETVIRLAPSGLQTVVDVEEPPSNRAPDPTGGCSHTDSHDGGGEPAMGRAADSW